LCLYWGSSDSGPLSKKGENRACYLHPQRIDETDWDRHEVYLIKSFHSAIYKTFAIVVPVRIRKEIMIPHQWWMRTVPSIYETLHESLQLVLLHRLGWSTLREVQESTYIAVCSGQDTLVVAPTAGGKTEAALIPVIDRVLKEGCVGVAVLYISPLKALINDQEERFSAFCLSTGLELMKWHGDVPKGDRTWPQEEPPHILMITPESLEVLLLERVLTRDLRNLRGIIIDEVHALMESERGIHLIALLDRLDRITGSHVQRIGLSATVGNPDKVLSWLGSDKYPGNLVRIPIPPREKQFSFTVEPDDKRRTEAIARIVTGKKALVFVNSRSEAEDLSRHLRERVAGLSIHHSSLSPASRHAAEEAFGHAGSACIICTSTLELGIDIGDLDVVVQVGPPPSVSSFLQRMGRSGRREKPPYVACVLKNSCELLCMAAVIECASRNEVEELMPPKRPCNVLIQQLLLSVYRSGRTSQRELTTSLLTLAPFRDISPRTFGMILTHLISTGYLLSDGDLLFLGPEAERTFGRSNWKDLFSVIAGGGEYRAVTPDGEVIGRLDARFVSSRRGGSFSLGGESWKLIKSDDDHKRVVVLPGEEQASGTFWTGGKSGFSPVVCEGVRRILSRGRTVLPIGGEETEILACYLAGFPEGIHSEGIHVWERKGRKGTDLVILTCKGRNFNMILRLCLEDLTNKKLRSRMDDFSLILHLPQAVSAEHFVYTLKKIQDMPLEEIESIIPEQSPERWKFGAALPGWAIRSMSLADQFHVAEFREILVGAEIRVLEEPDKTDESG
jgi:ATP-dependent Lhr-like helicase